jgi:hypothetical protein
MNCDCQIQEYQEPVMQYVVILLMKAHIYNSDLHPQLVQIQNQTPPSVQNEASSPNPSLYFELYLFSLIKNLLDNRSTGRRRRRPLANVSVFR